MKELQRSELGDVYQLRDFDDDLEHWIRIFLDILGEHVYYLREDISCFWATKRCEMPWAPSPFPPVARRTSWLTVWSCTIMTYCISDLFSGALWLIFHANFFNISNVSSSMYIYICCVLLIFGIVCWVLAITENVLTVSCFCVTQINVIINCRSLNYYKISSNSDVVDRRDTGRNIERKRWQWRQALWMTLIDRVLKEGSWIDLFFFQLLIVVRARQKRETCSVFTKKKVLGRTVSYFFSIINLLPQRACRSREYCYVYIYK